MARGVLPGELLFEDFMDPERTFTKYELMQLGGWGPALNLVDQAKNLKSGPKLVYRIMLSSLYGPNESVCDYTLEEIANKINLSTRMVKIHLEILISVKLIVRKKKGRRNIYLFLNPEHAKLTEDETKKGKLIADKKGKQISPIDESFLIKENPKTSTYKTAVTQETDFPFSHQNPTERAAAAFLHNNFSSKTAENLLKKYNPGKVLAVKRRFDGKKKKSKNPAGLIIRMLEDPIPAGEVAGAAPEMREEYLKKERVYEERRRAQSLNTWLNSLPKEERLAVRERAERHVSFLLKGQKTNKDLTLTMLRGTLWKEYDKWKQQRPPGKTIGEVLQGKKEML